MDGSYLELHTFHINVSTKVADSKGSDDGNDNNDINSDTDSDIGNSDDNNDHCHNSSNGYYDSVRVMIIFTDDNFHNNNIDNSHHNSDDNSYCYFDNSGHHGNDNSDDDNNNDCDNDGDDDGSDDDSNKRELGPLSSGQWAVMAGKPSPHTTTKHPHSANLKLASLKEEYFHQLSSTYTPLTFHLLHPTSTSLSMQMT